MSASLTQIAKELQELTKYQATTEPWSQSDYEKVVKKCLEEMYVDTGRASVFNRYTVERDPETEELMFSNNIGPDEEAYLLILCQIRFYKTVQARYNTLTSYSTDAISVTGGDKPYANLKNDIAEKQNERRIKFYKMPQFALSTD